jgi:hypothetical protein
VVAYHSALIALDHLVVAVSASAVDEAVGRLETLGLFCGGRWTHTGQGTANACFFFDGSYLELLWIHDEREVRLPAVAPLGLSARLRWRQSGGCPFGIGLRADALPVSTWSYAPSWAGGVVIPIVTAADAVAEPLVFISPLARPRPPGALAHRPPIAQPDVPLRVRGVDMVQRDPVSATVATVVRDAGVILREGATPHLTLTLGEGTTGAASLEPLLPLTLRW